MAVPATGPNRPDTTGVAALSPTDAWAVGQFGADVTLHWDGTRWAPVPSPAPPGGQIFPEAVSAQSQRNVWAVGLGPGKGPQGFSGAAIHWDGTRWALVSTPNPTSQSELTGVSADSPSDAWAIGSDDVGPHLQQTAAYVEHWNGKVWTLVPSPNPGHLGYVKLTGVSAVSSTDVWAVGFYFARRGVAKNLMLHWDGTKWTQVPTPLLPSTTDFVSSVSALSSNNVWGAGGGPAGTLVAHWDGRKWAPVPAPSPGRTLTGLNSVTIRSATDAWAVGCYCPVTIKKPDHTVVLHWDGRNWTQS